jgi:hypothetical protein
VRVLGTCDRSTGTEGLIFCCGVIKNLSFEGEINDKKYNEKNWELMGLLPLAYIFTHPFRPLGFFAFSVFSLIPSSVFHFPFIFSPFSIFFGLRVSAAKAQRLLAQQGVVQALANLLASINASVCPSFLSCAFPFMQMLCV